MDINLFSVGFEVEVVPRKEPGQEKRTVSLKKARHTIGQKGNKQASKQASKQANKQTTPSLHKQTNKQNHTHKKHDISVRIYKICAGFHCKHPFEQLHTAV